MIPLDLLRAFESGEGDEGDSGGHRERSLLLLQLLLRQSLLLLPVERQGVDSLGTRAATSGTPG